jgi:hypothetical protein
MTDTHEDRLLKKQKTTHVKVEPDQKVKVEPEQKVKIEPQVDTENEWPTTASGIPYVNYPNRNLSLNIYINNSTRQICTFGVNIDAMQGCVWFINAIRTQRDNFNDGYINYLSTIRDARHIEFVLNVLHNVKNFEGSTERELLHIIEISGLWIVPQVIQVVVSMLSRRAKKPTPILFKTMMNMLLKLKSRLRGEYPFDVDPDKVVPRFIPLLPMMNALTNNAIRHKVEPNQLSVALANFINRRLSDIVYRHMPTQE